jgi:hypothetical protein
MAIRGRPALRHEVPTNSQLRVGRRRRGSQRLAPTREQGGTSGGTQLFGGFNALGVSATRLRCFLSNTPLASPSFLSYQNSPTRPILTSDSQPGRPQISSCRRAPAPPGADRRRGDRARDRVSTSRPPSAVLNTVAAVDCAYTSTATTELLDMLGPAAAGPQHLFIGSSVPGGVYSNAYGSIGWKRFQQPFLNQVATFTITAPGRHVEHHGLRRVLLRDHVRRQRASRARHRSGPRTFCPGDRGAGSTPAPWLCRPPTQAPRCVKSAPARCPTRTRRFVWSSRITHGRKEPPSPTCKPPSRPPC